jgi:hypothetical protein
MTDDMANCVSPVTATTPDVIAGHNSLAYEDHVNLSAQPRL